MPACASGTSSYMFEVVSLSVLLKHITFLSDDQQLLRPHHKVATLSYSLQRRMTKRAWSSPQPSPQTKILKNKGTATFRVHLLPTFPCLGPNLSTGQFTECIHTWKKVPIQHRQSWQKLLIWNGDSSGLVPTVAFLSAQDWTRLLFLDITRGDSKWREPNHLVQIFNRSPVSSS